MAEWWRRHHPAVALLGPLNPVHLVAGAAGSLRTLRERIQAERSTLDRRQVMLVSRAKSCYYLYAAVAPGRRSYPTLG
jgi:hypothetical protein